MPTISTQGLSTVSIVVTVLANILIGLLIGSICLCVILQIKRKIQGRTASPDRQSGPDSGNSHKVSYECVFHVRLTLPGFRVRFRAATLCVWSLHVLPGPPRVSSG
ncbi:hypothetical protein AMELA_G00186350 [Ameiurus melas]|uniref:Uncharacterized protein n=1 Tax=Ameiurus melas TaxID=219545 RepID=A0A7J6A7T2_AMEME|nr:hypothetical protein AMELA_G00186350 [Ameiurus melas]